MLGRSEDEQSGSTVSTASPESYFTWHGTGRRMFPVLLLTYLAISGCHGGVGRNSHRVGRAQHVTRSIIVTSRPRSRTPGLITSSRTPTLSTGRGWRGRPLTSTRPGR